MALLKISKGGQISIPAAIRKQWHAKHVFAEEVENGLLIMPAPDDPIDALVGCMRPFAKMPDRSLEEIMEEERAAEDEITRREWGT